MARALAGAGARVVVVARTVDEIEQVAAELPHQYKVTYARPDSLIPTESVTVSSPRPGLTVRGTPVRVLRERP